MSFLLCCITCEQHPSMRPNTSFQSARICCSFIVLSYFEAGSPLPYTCTHTLVHLLPSKIKMLLPWHIIHDKVFRMHICEEIERSTCFCFPNRFITAPDSQDYKSVFVLFLFYQRPLFELV